MTEKHFWHPALGYFVAIDCAARSVTLPDGQLVELRPEITAADYPAGTIEVPPRPTPEHTWDGAEWQAPPPEPEEAP
ncbi:hypothetical protein SAMN06297129_2451 [Pseudooceanicola antarcticus]|uniref:Uncharacterized protein n=1 Tax=Pseudooceanicola antarcticus TaxID=1247613 RepID=A0A285IZ77_9RHOB|nr:hypothetical protein [Pseudooceanicola antarcticus]PJE25762.1 hypothetical protein CVM39_18835 [Pseudooceanicola antarcticus]SNY52957.1 hypothetical protein SAMN06297129_2451 [Pseudooceanicola antarcticus]